MEKKPSSKGMVRVSFPLKLRALIEQVTGQPCKKHHLVPLLTPEMEKHLAAMLEQIALRVVSYAD